MFPGNIWVNGQRVSENYCCCFSIKNIELFFKLVADIISRRSVDHYITAENIALGAIDYLSRINNDILQSGNLEKLIELMEKGQAIQAFSSLSRTLLPQLISDSRNTIVNILVISGETIIQNIMYLPNENDISKISPEKGLLELFYDSLKEEFVDTFVQSQESWFYLSGEHNTPLGEKTYF